MTRRADARFCTGWERVGALPGVRSAAVAESLVLADQALRRTISVAGQEPDRSAR